jgi:predicted RND superfamily exporter protein
LRVSSTFPDCTGIAPPRWHWPARFESGRRAVAAPVAEVEQAMALKNAISEVMFGLIALLVTFSVFNTFIMLVFERTREFGMLLAIGMRRAASSHCCN